MLSVLLDTCFLFNFKLIFLILRFEYCFVCMQQIHKLNKTKLK